MWVIVIIRSYLTWAKLPQLCKQLRVVIYRQPIAQTLRYFEVAYRDWWTRKTPPTRSRWWKQTNSLKLSSWFVCWRAERRCAAAAYQSKSSLPEGQAANERDAVEWRWSVTCDYKSPLDGGLLTDRWTLAGWMDILCVFFLPAFTWGCPCWWHTWCGCKCSCTFHELLCSPLRRRPKRGKKKKKSHFNSSGQ